MSQAMILSVTRGTDWSYNQASLEARTATFAVSNIAPEGRNGRIRRHHQRDSVAWKAAEILCSGKAFLVEYRLINVKVFFN